MAKRWITVGNYDILLEASQVKASSSPSSTDQIPYFTWAGAAPTTSDFLPPGVDVLATPSANPAISSILVPRDGTLKFMTLADPQASLNGPAQITIYRGGIATAMTVTLNAGGTFAFQNTLSLAVSRGEELQAFCNGNTGFPYLQFSVLLLP